MNLSRRIKQSVAKFNTKLWPLHEKEPSGKPLDLVGSKIVLMYNSSNEKEYLELTNQLSNIKRQLDSSSSITICNLSDIQVLNENADVEYFSFNDFHLLGKPKPKLNNWINNNEFDILISFVSSENPWCNNLISSIKSDFKAGLYNPNNVKLFDLTIKQEADNINIQLELFIQYLNKLNINK